MVKERIVLRHKVFNYAFEVDKEKIDNIKKFPSLNSMKRI